MKGRSDETRVEVAFDIANRAHGNQRDKVGEPYMHHVMFVADQAKLVYGFGSDEHIVAILHDVLEDAVDADQYLAQIWIVFGAVILRSLLALKHEPQENYMIYIMRVIKDKVARNVKRLDLGHNMMTERITKVRRMTERECAKQVVYKQALFIVDHA